VNVLRILQSTTFINPYDLDAKGAGGGGGGGGGSGTRIRPVQSSFGHVDTEDLKSSASEDEDGLDLGSFGPIAIGKSKKEGVKSSKSARAKAAAERISKFDD
jgi:hypothetical protein